MEQNHEYTICAGWEQNTPIGTLHITKQRGKEIQSFTYNKDWLLTHPGLCLDSELLEYPGPQYTRTGTFRFLSDTSPERWGRQLINQKEKQQAAAEDRPIRTLTENDYILGVSDYLRTGGLRIYDGTNFLAKEQPYAPSESDIRILQAASLNLEKNDTTELVWLNQLCEFGSPLGGSRPKVNIKDGEGNLWIAKFASMRDVNHIEEWEQITAELAKKCGLQMAETKLIKDKDTCIFLTKRFDRNQDTRIHFASALTMLGKQDGEDAGFMDIANFIRNHTAEPKEDLKELWRRIVFMISVSNTDCHLRNHGFLLQRDGWHLAPAYDINPNESGSSLALRIYGQDHSLDMRLAIQAASYYEIDSPKSEIEKIQTIIKTNYIRLAEKHHIPRKETIKMMRAFHLDISDLH